MIKQPLSVGAGPQAPCALNHLEGDQMEEQGLCLRPQGLTREGCSGLGPLTQWMDSGRQLLPSMVPDNRILARQPFVKFGAEDCLLLTLPCLSIWGWGVLYSWSPVSAALGREEGSPWLYLVSEIRELEWWRP